MTYIDELANKPGLLPIVQPDGVAVGVLYKALLPLISDEGMVTRSGPAEVTTDLDVQPLDRWDSG